MLGGCPSPAPAHHALPDGATQFLALGTGDTSFVPLVEGGTIELVHGPQGGYHLPVTCWIYGIDPEGRVIHYVASTPDGAVLADAPLALMTRNLTADDGGWLRLGDRLIFGDITGPADVVGMTVVVRVALEEARTVPGDGGLLPGTELAAAEYTVTIVDTMP